MDHARSRQLIESAVHGEAAALEELVVAYTPRLHAYVRLHMGPALRAHEGSVDVAQSVCREVLQDIRNGFDYRGEEAFVSWLFTSALNKLRDRHRFHNRKMRDPAREEKDLRVDEMPGYSSLTPSREAIGRENIERLEQAFDRLPEHYREMLTLSRIVGLRPEEIAENTGRTPKAVRMVLGRALTRLAYFYDHS